MGQKIDREAVYTYLWERTDSRGRVKFSQTGFARSLNVDRVTIARIMKEFIDEGRITKLKEGHDRIVTYIVKDPEAYEWDRILNEED